MIVACAHSGTPDSRLATQQPQLGSRVVPIVESDRLRLRDLDRDGKLSAFEDWRLAPAIRAEDLIRWMTLAEKAGTMDAWGFARCRWQFCSLPKSYDIEGTRAYMAEKHITSLVTSLGVSPRKMHPITHIS